MSGDTKQPLLPRLRFPEFRDEGEWENKQLRALGSFFRGLTYTANDVSEDGLLVLRSSNIQDGILILDKDLVFIDKPCPDNIKLKIGDIAICMSNGSKALVGKSAEFRGGYTGHLTVGAFCSIFRPSIEFGKLIFQSEKYSKFVSLAIGGGSINNLKNSDLEGFEHPVPRKQSEQQKIADCLSSLDELITAATQKLDILKTHKKGLMQQLFPREGETVPRLRFPEFRSTGEWNKKPLGAICNVLNNRRQPISSGQRKSGPFPYYGASGIVDFVDNYLFDERLVLIGEDGAKWGAFEKTAFIVEGKYWVNNHAHVLRPIQVNDVLLENYLVMLDLSPYITGAAPPKLTLAKLKGLVICFPLAPSEQQKIADCLSSLDDLITAQNKKIDALKAHKKGLMQQLFPVLDEVSA